MDDEETQGLMKSNNPQDPPTNSGPRISSYSDWSAYDKQASVPVEDDSLVQKKIAIVVICALLFVFGGYFMLTRNAQQKLEIIDIKDVKLPDITNGDYKEPNTKIFRQPSTAVENVYNKINTGLKDRLGLDKTSEDKANDDEEAQRFSQELDRRLAREREKESQINKELRDREQEKPQVKNDTDIIDDVLKQYLQKAKQNAYNFDDENALNDNVMQDENQKILEDKLVNQESLNNDQVVLTLDDIEVADTKGDQLDNIVNDNEDQLFSEHQDHSETTMDQLEATKIILEPETSESELFRENTIQELKDKFQEAQMKAEDLVSNQSQEELDNDMQIPNTELNVNDDLPSYDPIQDQPIDQPPVSPIYQPEYTPTQPVDPQQDQMPPVPEFPAEPVPEFSAEPVLELPNETVTESISETEQKEVLTDQETQPKQDNQDTPLVQPQVIPTTEYQNDVAKLEDDNTPMSVPQDTPITTQPNKEIESYQIESNFNDNYDYDDNQKILTINDIVQPQSSSQKLRFIQLSNGVKVFLIQDTDFENSVEMVASLQSGLWDDLSGSVGISDIMQHMIVEGIPVGQDKSLYDLVSRLDGLCEGFTEDLFTNFQIELKNETQLLQVLPSLLMVLNRPKLTKEQVELQIKEIEGEDSITFVGDSWKMAHIIQLLTQQNHPVKRTVQLQTRNKEQFCMKTQLFYQLVPDVLLRYYNDHFSSNLLTLVIKSDIDIDKLNQIIMDSDLKLIKDKSLKPFTPDPNCIKPLQSLYLVQPLLEQNIILKYKTNSHNSGIQLLFQVDKFKHYNVKTTFFKYNYIFQNFLQYLLQDNQQGSLGYVLSKAQLMDNKLIMGQVNIAETYTITTIQFSIQPELTELQKTFHIINIFNDYIQFLLEQDSLQLEQVYLEYLQFQDINFNFEFKEEFQNILLLAQKLHNQKDVTKIFKEDALPFDLNQFREFLLQYQKNFIILVGRKDFKYQPSSFAKTDDIEFLMEDVLQIKDDTYHLDYSIKDISKDSMLYLRSNTGRSQFQLPSIRQILPLDFTIFDVCGQIDKTDESIQEQVIQLPTLFSEDTKQLLQGNEAQVSDPILGDLVTNFHLELPNIFQKGNFELCEIRARQALTQPLPFLLVDKKLYNVWWKPSDKKHIPQVFTGIFLQSPELSTVERSKTLIKVYQKYLQEVAKEHFYEETTQLGYQVQIENNMNGLNILTMGWSDKQEAFLTKVMKLLKGEIKPISEIDTFNQIKTTLAIEIKDFYKQKLSTLTQQYYFPFMMLRPVHTPEQIEATLNQISFNDFQDFQGNIPLPYNFQDQLIKQNQGVQLAFIGNLPPSQALSQSNIILQSLEIQERQLVKEKAYWSKTMNLEESSLVYPVKGNTEESSTFNYYQLGLRDNKKYSLLQLLSYYLQKQADEHYSSHQMQIKLKSIGCSDGLSVYNQGSADLPFQMNLQIEDFILTQHQALSEYSDSEFDQVKWETIRRLQNVKKFETIKEEAIFIWEKIYNRNNQFNDLDISIQMLEDTNKGEFLKFYNDFFGSQQAGKLSVQVYGTKQLEAVNVTNDDEFKLVVLDNTSILKEGQNMAQRTENVVLSLEEAIKSNKKYFNCYYSLNN